MKSLTLLLWSLVAEATAVIRPRQSDDEGCCFGLSSVGMIDKKVTEGHTGGLTLGGPFQKGGFCYDKATKTVRDGLKHNCFMRGPTWEFQCYAGLVGATAFDITPGTNERPYLTYDNGPGAFYACAVGTGVNQYYDIYSEWKDDTTDCIMVALALDDWTSGCHFTGNETTTTPTSSSQETLSATGTTIIRGPQSSATRVVTVATPGSSSVTSVGPLSSKPANVSTTSATKTWSATISRAAGPTNDCRIAASAPSIAPTVVGTFDESSPDGINDTSAKVSITSTNSTIFVYDIPDSFLGETTSLCALQFRMPACSQLPEGYPCYSFSGLEQEYLSHSGMNFDLIFDTVDGPWNASVLHQVTPGENQIIGTFECGRYDNGNEGDREMRWLVTSVNNFGLEFLQAGVGEDAQFRDGIGAWILACQ